MTAKEAASRIDDQYCEWGDDHSFTEADNDKIVAIIQECIDAAVADNNRWKNEVKETNHREQRDAFKRGLGQCVLDYEKEMIDVATKKERQRCAEVARKHHPHLCPSCGLTDEEEGCVQEQMKLVEKIAKAIEGGE